MMIMTMSMMMTMMMTTMMMMALVMKTNGNDLDEDKKRVLRIE